MGKLFSSFLHYQILLLAHAAINQSHLNELQKIDKQYNLECNIHARYFKKMIKNFSTFQQNNTQFCYEDLFIEFLFRMMSDVFFVTIPRELNLNHNFD